MISLSWFSAEVRSISTRACGRAMTSGSGITPEPDCSCISLLILFRLTLFSSFIRTCSGTDIRSEHSLTNNVRVMLSGMRPMDETISLISPAFRTGSFLVSSRSSLVLKLIKFRAFERINFSTSAGWFFLVKESGSSLSGNRTIFTFMPCSRTMSMPRKDALIPAGSPS